jgi:hypothetical protein
MSRYNGTDVEERPSQMAPRPPNTPRDETKCPPRLQVADIKFIKGALRGVENLLGQIPPA